MIAASMDRSPPMFEDDDDDIPISSSGAVQTEDVSLDDDEPRSKPKATEPAVTSIHLF
jgi:hypothetical protein